MMGEHNNKRPPTEGDRAMKDAHTRCAHLPNYSGSIVVIFTKDFQDVQLGSTLPPDRAPMILRALLDQLDPPPSRLIVPGH